MKIDSKKIRPLEWLGIGMILGMVVFYVFPLILERGNADIEFILTINERLIEQGNEQKDLIASYELQVAFYEHVLALDVEACKEKAQDARVVFEKMVGRKMEVKNE